MPTGGKPPSVAHKVTVHPFARADLFDLYSYIETQSGRSRAGDYVDRIEALCATLADFPKRGIARDDLGGDIRTIAMERRILIVYQPTADQVTVLRVLYAGRDFGADDLPG